MGDITIKMKNGDTKKFVEKRRSGGSWSQKLEFQPGFVGVVDVWGEKTFIPSSEVLEVVHAGEGGF